jgi:hypothetical protein
MSKPQVDLDGNKDLRDYGDQTPFLPFGEGEYVVKLVAFLFHDGYKGKAYRAKVKIVESDRDDVKVDKIFAMQFPIEGQKEQRNAKLKELRSFLAAVMGGDPKDEAFKANAAIETLSEATAEEVLEDVGYLIKVSCRDKVLRDKATKEPLKDKSGKEKTATNRFYDHVEAA